MGRKDNLTRTYIDRNSEWVAKNESMLPAHVRETYSKQYDEGARRLHRLHKWHETATRWAPSPWTKSLDEDHDWICLADKLMEELFVMNDTLEDIDHDPVDHSITAGGIQAAHRIIRCIMALITHKPGAILGSDKSNFSLDPMCPSFPEDRLEDEREEFVYALFVKQLTHEMGHLALLTTTTAMSRTWMPSWKATLLNITLAFETLTNQDLGWYFDRWEEADNLED